MDVRSLVVFMLVALAAGLPPSPAMTVDVDLAPVTMAPGGTVVLSFTLTSTSELSRTAMVRVSLPSGMAVQETSSSPDEGASLIVEVPPLGTARGNVTLLADTDVRGPIGFAVSFPVGEPGSPQVTLERTLTLAVSPSPPALPDEPVIGGPSPAPSIKPSPAPTVIVASPTAHPEHDLVLAQLASLRARTEAAYRNELISDEQVAGLLAMADEGHTLVYEGSLDRARSRIRTVNSTLVRVEGERFRSNVRGYLTITAAFLALLGAAAILRSQPAGERCPYCRLPLDPEGSCPYCSDRFATTAERQV